MPPSWMLGQWRIGDWQRIGAEVGCLLLQEIFLCPNPLKIPNSRWQQMYPHTSTIYLYYRLQAAVQERSWRQQTEWAAEISLKNGNKCLLLLLLLLQVHLKRNFDVAFRRDQNPLFYTLQHSRPFQDFTTIVPIFMQLGKPDRTLRGVLRLTSITPERRKQQCSCKLKARETSTV